MHLVVKEKSFWNILDIFKHVVAELIAHPLKTSNGRHIFNTRNTIIRERKLDVSNTSLDDGPQIMKLVKEFEHIIQSIQLSVS